MSRSAGESNKEPGIADTAANGRLKDDKLIPCSVMALESYIIYVNNNLNT
ncbi:hypothetical protein CLV42_102341 [Chitinophaga ginsengisoli]|uniref:Uncharacterized protein n=1 Tax=Chitinophaga ginsengisoli TaxID=363837 RepID=A0A2P8GLD1_9BACT|nr:hypothetical protein CLV42_102341 [Chitinophaga ginsengisoli]